jgi:DMSO reductase family type II enzyme heme b subunit
MVKAYRVKPNDAGLFDPDSALWQSIRGSELALEPTPLTAQPSQYIQVKWDAIPYGGIAQLSARAAHDGDLLYFHLTWADETENSSIRDTNEFPDAAAVLFPVNGDAPLQSMGSPQAPVNAWYWRADAEEPFTITAQGTGTTRRALDPELQANGTYSGGTWNVVIRRKLASSGAEHVNLVQGVAGKVGFAVWQGAHQERGGLKAVTPDWEPLEIEA